MAGKRVHIRKNRHGHLYFDFYWQGIRCREGIGLIDSKANRDTAEKHAAVIEAELRAGIFDYQRHFPHGNRIRDLERRSPKGLTLSEFAQEWLAERAPPHGLKPSTHQDYTNIMERRVLPVLGHLPVKDITGKDLLAFRKTLKDVGPQRVNNIFVPLKAALNEAYRRGLTDNQPGRAVRPSRTDDNDVQPFDRYDLAALWFVLDPYWRNFLDVACYTGMRTGELLALKWNRVDLDTGYIHVREIVVRGITTLPKTRQSRRDILILPPVREALLSQREITGGSGLVFPSQAGTPHSPQNIRQRIWHPALEKAEVDRRTLYQTRHTYASMMLMAGEHPLWVAAQMGHTSAEMLYRRYAKYIPRGDEGRAFEREYCQPGCQP